MKFNINNFLNYLYELYPNAKCSLDYQKDYELVIAVMLSAQVSDVAVNKVTKILFKKYNSLNKLKKANLKDIEDIIHPLGMYKRKALNIIEIANKLNNKVPDSREELMQLSGVGQKVANVVLAELYHLPYFAVDTHCIRIAKRLNIVKVNDNPKVIEERIIKLIPQEELIKANHSFIAFGRDICNAKHPRCEECKIKCHFYKCVKLIQK